MIRTAAALLAALGLLISACRAVPDTALSRPARTAVPTWTLPFVLEPSTPAPTDPPRVLATPTAAAAAAITRLAPTALPTEAPPALSPTPVSPPRLVIPYLKLDRDVERVGIANGTWDLEHLGDEVGWLATTGEHPGDDLAVVLVGHVTTAPGTYGPFAGIGQLVYDEQIVYRWAGHDYVYAVRGQSRADEADVQRLYVPDGNQLLLVTCSSFDYFSMLYTRRLIITAEWIGTTASQ